MTPAINTAKKHKIAFQVHEYQHDASADSYGLEAADKLGVQPEHVFKTLVVQLSDGQLAVGVIPVCAKLSMKKIAKAVGSKKAEMADKLHVEKTTGYVLGGVSPLGQKKRLKTLIDSSAQQFQTIYVSAGRRGLEIELNPNDLIKLVNGIYSDICQ